MYIAQYISNNITRCKIRNPEYAGKPLEPLVPNGNNLKDWVIRRHPWPQRLPKDIHMDNGIVYSPNKYRETEGIKVYTPIKSWSKERKREFKMRQWEHVNVESHL